MIYFLQYTYSYALWEPMSGGPPCQGPQQYTTLLKQWHSRFIAFISQNRPSFTAKDSAGAILLQIHYIGLSIMLTLAMDHTVSTTEALTPSFMRIVALATSLLDSNQPEGMGTMLHFPDNVLPSAPHSPLHNFTFDMGIIGPLCYTAVRCRSSPIRWQAIALLKCAPAREGIWSAAMTAKMAEKFVMIEESYRTSSLPISMPLRPRSHLTSAPGSPPAREGPHPNSYSNFMAQSPEAMLSPGMSITSLSQLTLDLNLNLAKNQSDIYTAGTFSQSSSSSPDSDIYSYRNIDNNNYPDSCNNTFSHQHYQEPQEQAQQQVEGGDDVVEDHLALKFRKPRVHERAIKMRISKIPIHSTGSGVTTTMMKMGVVVREEVITW